MGIETAIAAATLAATVGGTAYSIDQQREAEENQQEAAEQERAMNEIENARKRRRAIAQRRIQAGQINNAAATSNTVGSTGAQSARGAVVGDTGTGLASFESQIAGNNNRLSFLSAASENQANAQLGSTIAQLGAQFGGTDMSSFFQGGGGGGTQAAASAGGSGPSGPPGFSTPSTNTYPTNLSFTRG